MILTYMNDTHLRASRPSCRKDEGFYQKQLDKLEEALQVHRRDQPVRLHGGDLFHVSNSPLSLINDVLPIIRREGGLLVNPGNHDFFGANTDTLRRSGLGVLESAGVVQYPHPDCEFTDYGRQTRIVVRSAPYMISYPEDFYWFENKVPGVLYAVMAHDMLVTRPVPFPHKLIKDLRTNADIVFASHWHSQFCLKQGGTWFVNSGPLDIQTVDQRHIRPAVVVVTANGMEISAELEFLKTTGYEEVEVTDQDQKEIGLADDFVKEVLASNLAEGANFEQAVLLVAKESGYKDEVIQRVLGRLKEAQTCAGREQ